jgi:hypothetical protein
MVHVDGALRQQAVNMKRGGMGDVGSLVERTGEWEQRQIARYVAALDSIVLRLDVNSASEVIIQQGSDETPRSEVLRGLPFISLLGQQPLKISSTPGTWRQCFDVRLDCELCFKPHLLPSLPGIYT